jgi:hypothetical protein
MEKYKTRKSTAGSVPRNVRSAVSTVRIKLHLQIRVISIFGLKMVTNAFEMHAVSVYTGTRFDSLHRATT